MAPKTGKAKPHKAKGEKKKKEEKGLGSFILLLLFFCLVDEKLDFEKKLATRIPRCEQFCLSMCFHLIKSHFIFSWQPIIQPHLVNPYTCL